jgi:hypothetical protein
MPRRLLAYSTPSSLSGLVAWLKADAISASDGDAVASWVDSSGNSNTPVQATAANKPTYTTNVLNGLPVVRFDGNDGLTMPTAGNFDLATPTIFVVAKRNAGTSGSIMGKSTTGFTDGRRRKMAVATSSGGIAYAAGSDSQSIAITATPGNWNMFGVVATSNTSHSIYLNGTKTDFTTTLADSTLNAANMIIGSNFAVGTEPFNGDIAEIIIFNRALSSTQVVGIENYLANKYNLPVSLELGGAPRSAVSGRVTIRDYGNAVKISAGQSVTWTNTPFNTPTVVSACVWVKLRANTASTYDVPFGFGNTRWFFLFNSTTNKPGFNIKVSGVEKGSGFISPALLLDHFYLLCGTYDKDAGASNLTIRVYDEHGQLYGSNASTQTGSMDSATAALTLGRDPVRAFNMSIDADEVHVYSRILTTNEQAALAIGTEPSSTSLELWTRCDEASGNLTDSSGNSRTGTNNGCTFIRSFRIGRNYTGSGVAA